MARYFFILITMASLSACSTFDREELIGTWQGQESDGTIPMVKEPSKTQFTFKKDETYTMKGAAGEQSGSYSWLGNSLELVLKDGRALQVGVAKLENDILVLNFRPLEEKGKLTLSRVMEQQSE